MAGQVYCFSTLIIADHSNKGTALRKSPRSEHGSTPTVTSQNSLIQRNEEAHLLSGQVGLGGSMSKFLEECWPIVDSIQSATVFPTSCLPKAMKATEMTSSKMTLRSQTSVKLSGHYLQHVHRELSVASIRVTLTHVILTSTLWDRRELLFSMPPRYRWENRGSEWLEASIILWVKKKKECGQCSIY